MSIKNALNHIMNGNLDAMRSELSGEMTAKAMDRLEEKKLDIANSYFGKK